MSINLLELEQNMFENAWNAIARDCEIRNCKSEFGKITFSITQKYLFSKSQTYSLQLEPAPYDDWTQHIFCTVSGIDSYTKHKFAVKRKLSTLAFYSDLKKNKSFDTAWLFVYGILSLEISQKNI